MDSNTYYELKKIRANSLLSALERAQEAFLRLQSLEEQFHPTEADHDEVSHGKVVTVRFPAFDEEETFMLGSREEAAHASIEVYSPTSPLGAAVLGKRVGDSTSYTLANGKEMTVEVVRVQPYVP